MTLHFRIEKKNCDLLIVRNMLNCYSIFMSLYVQSYDFLFVFLITQFPLYDNRNQAPTSTHQSQIHDSLKLHN